MAAITEDECRRLKLLRILETAGQRVLTYTLQCGTPGKPSTVTLLDYLDNLPRASTANYIRVKDKSKCFNKTDKDQIIADPPCTAFDITLSVKAIKLACENVAGPNEMVNKVNVWASPTPLPGRELECLTNQIKDTRNAVVHEGEPLDEAAFLKKVDTLRALFSSCLRATKDRYVRDDAEYQAERAAVQAKVTDIQQETLGISEMLRRSAVSLLPDFKQETQKDLRAGLDSARYLTPLHFLSGIPEDRVEVSDIFCDIILAEENGMARQGNTHKVAYLEVLRLCEDASASMSAGAGLSGQARPQVLVVEGEAGSGKTTWVCFLVQQWLTPQDRRRMQGLERYELLLRVVCRERSSNTLEGLVQQLLPESHLRYRRLLLPLLKKCRVLVVIDGIDEMNDVSRPLVANILSEAAATAFTVVCTTRPHSVQDLKAEVRRMHFQVSHVKMLGIRDTQRTELFLRHYQWLCAAANTAPDTDALRQAVEGIVWREVFRLPLNLLFLATVFFFEPHRVSSNLSQCDLYQHIHTWCREKLQARLGATSQAGQARLGVLSQAGQATLGVPSQAGRAWPGTLSQAGWAWLGALSQAGWAWLGALSLVRWAWLGMPSQAGRSRRSRQAPVDRVLDVIYEVALKGLLQDRMCLNDQDLQEVEDACTMECLDPEAVLSAFYSTRREVTAGMVRETYIAPHKSLQEFMAAKGIARRVRQYSEGAIERVLREYTAGQDPPMDQLQQTLVHLLSLLTQQGDAMKEAVDLLHRSGVIRASDWLYLLTDAMAPDAVVQHAAEQQGAEQGLILFDDTVVRDERVTSVMLQHLPRRKVRVRLERELADVDNLARGLARHEVTRLCLHYHWQHPHRKATSATLLRRLPRSDFREFSGHLDAEDLALLPRGLSELFLVVRDSDHAQTFLPALAEAVRSSSNPRLSSMIRLHVPVAAVTPAAVTCRPAHLDLGLYLSGVTDLLVEAAVDIMVALYHPYQGFWSLVFPEATLDLRGWRDLFSRLQQAEVTVGGYVYVPNTHVTKDEERQLETLATAMLHCRVFRHSNESLWRMYM